MPRCYLTGVLFGGDGFRSVYPTVVDTENGARTVYPVFESAYNARVYTSIHHPDDDARKTIENSLKAADAKLYRETLTKAKIYRQNNRFASDAIGWDVVGSDENSYQGGGWGDDDN